MAKSRKEPAVSIGVDPEWEARHAFETLQRAEEIKGNAGLMRRVRQHAAKQQRATAKILKSAPHSQSRDRR